MTIETFPSIADCHWVQRPAHSTISTEADATVAQNGICCCYPERHNFPVYTVGDFEIGSLSHTVTKCLKRDPATPLNKATWSTFGHSVTINSLSNDSVYLGALHRCRE